MSKLPDNTAYYQRNARAFFEGTHVVDMTPLYAKFETLLPATARILDAGCGSGRDTKYFLGRGYSVTAFDAAPELARLASEYVGQPVLVESFASIVFREEFDAVWACASLVHLDARELEATLRRLTDSLRAGGVFYMSFKYGKGELKADDRVFVQYDETALGPVIELIPDLKIAESWVSRDVRPGRSNFWLNVLCRRARGPITNS